MSGTPAPPHPGGTAPVILAIEDSPDLRAVLHQLLSAHGFAARTAADAATGVRLALESPPDLVILDVGLPDRSGLEVLEELRRRGFRAPVLVLTARGSVADRVSGLDAGADDYLAKPFEHEELVARVRALLRRASLRAEALRLRVADVELDPITRTVTRGGEPIPLTQTEYALLEYLMRHAGREVSRELIAQHVWQRTLDPDSNIVDVYVTYLRKKLETDGRPRLLHTIRGVGYVFGEQRDGA